jgi:S-(hydroxymethyl)glutathione dehydrogenase/alcohol dehydrogenase
MNQALNSVRAGGTAVVMGMHALKEEVPISAGALIAQNKRLLGSFAGSSRPLVDLPKLVELFRGGRLPVDKLITHRYSLDQVNQAFADLEAGKVARGVLVMA